MAMTAQYVELTKEQRAQLLKLTDDQAVELTRIWVDLWDEISLDIQDAVNDLVALMDSKGSVPKYKVAKLASLQRVLKQIEGRIGELSEEAMELIASESDTATKLGAFHNQQLLSAALPPGQTAIAVGFDRVPVEALDAITARATEQIHKRTWPLADDMVQAMKSELTRGIAGGRNPNAVATSIMQRTQGKFSGGLGRAITIARTEMLDAHRAGSAESDKANRDVLDGWTWMASLSGRTCAACLGMHGTKHDINEPGPLGHQNCRCSRAPLTKSWRDLGFDVDEPESLMPDAAEWFENLTPDSQKLILGRDRHKAWADGDYPMSSWAVRQKNEGWRDSYVVSKLPQ